MTGMEKQAIEVKVLVWDLPTRIFHWALALSLAGSWLSHEAKASGFQVHQFLGCLALALVLWRIAWGFTGPPFARFASFVRGPGRVIRYLRSAGEGQESNRLGHNPAGGWAILLMLALVGFQAVSGLFNGGEMLMEGPWYHVLDKPWKGIVREAHEVGFNLLIVMVALHLAAIAVHRFRHGQRLVWAMITGFKAVAPSSGQKGISSHGVWLALGLAVLAGAAVWLLVALAPQPTLESLDIF